LQDDTITRPSGITRRGATALGISALLPACASGGQRPVSDHFDGSVFLNPDGTGPRSLLDLARWKLEGGSKEWPEAYLSPFGLDRPPPRVERGQVRVSFVGHASFLIQGAGLNILTDPIWSDRASPFSFAGPKRANPPGIAFEHLPPIDVVLISHGHYDHLDLETIDRLWRRDRPRIVTPLGNDATIQSHRSDIGVTSVDWGDVVVLGNGVEVVVEQVHHWSARGVFDRNQALWCGFLLRGIGDGVFFAGDTGFDEGRPFQRIARQHGAVGLALLPIGAYEPRWFMANQHMDPADAVRGFRLLGARQAFGYHWGTFQLTDEAVDEPAADLATALGEEKIEASRFIAARPGQVWAG
jgi:L-ascorbate metabolism protein UlaG (beta-lactamase superfamily)